MEPVRFSKTDLLAIAQELGVPNLSGSSAIMNSRLEEHLMQTGRIPVDPSQVLQKWLDFHGYQVDESESVLERIAKEIGYTGPYPVTDLSVENHLMRYSDIPDSPSPDLLSWLAAHNFDIGGDDPVEPEVDTRPRGRQKGRKDDLPTAPESEPDPIPVSAAPEEDQRPKRSGRTGSRTRNMESDAPAPSPVEEVHPDPEPVSVSPAPEEQDPPAKKSGRTGSRRKHQDFPPPPSPENEISRAAESALSGVDGIVVMVPDPKKSKASPPPDKTGEGKKTRTRKQPVEVEEAHEVVVDALRPASRLGPEKDYSHLWFVRDEDIPKINSILKEGHVVVLTPRSTGVSAQKGRKVPQVWVNRRGRVKTEWTEQELPAVQEMDSKVADMDLQSLFALMKSSKVRVDQVKPGVTADRKPFPLYNLIKTHNDDGSECPTKVLKMRAKVLLKKWAASQVSGRLIYY